MGSQVPDVTVRFAASFGRRLLYDPKYNSLEPVARLAWFEANLIATEFDGWFPEAALQQRFALLQSDSYYQADRFLEVIIGPLSRAGLLDDHKDDDGWPWHHIAGWDKYQPDPLNHTRAMTGAERVAKHRAKKRAETEAVTPVTPVTPRAGASSSSSSSVSKRPSRKRTNGRLGSSEDPTPGEAKAILEKYGYKPPERTS